MAKKRVQSRNSKKFFLNIEFFKTAFGLRLEIFGIFSKIVRHSCQKGIVCVQTLYVSRETFIREEGFFWENIIFIASFRLLNKKLLEFCRKFCGRVAKNSILRFQTNILGFSKMIPKSERKWPTIFDL